MNSEDYGRIRNMIEQRFRQDMAALERVWFTINGANPPDSPVTFEPPRVAEPDPQATSPAPEPMRSAASLGIPTASAIDGRTGNRRSKTLTPEAIEKKRAYMRAYWAKRKKAADQ